MEPSEAEWNLWNFCSSPRETFGEGDDGSWRRYSSRKDSVLVKDTRLSLRCLSLRLFKINPPFSSKLELTLSSITSSYSAQPLSHDWGASTWHARDRSCIWYISWRDIISAKRTLKSVSDWLFVPGVTCTFLVLFSMFSC